jgi:hypothetical protein
MTLGMMKTTDTSTCNLAAANEVSTGKFSSKYALFFLLCLMHEMCSFVLYLEVRCLFAALLVCYVKGNCGLRAGRVLTILLLVIVICGLVTLLLCNAILNQSRVCCGGIVPGIGCCVGCCLGLSGAIF